MIAGVLRVLGALGIALALFAGIVGVMVLVTYAVGLIFLRVPLTGKHRNTPLDLPPAGPAVESESKKPRARAS